MPFDEARGRPHFRSRRTFLAELGSAAGAAAFFGPRASATRAAGNIHFGYAAITWGGNDQQAIEDISAVGFKGIQLRASVVQQYGDRPQALRDLLQKHGLTMVALSSGNVRIGPELEAEEIQKHTRHATFVRDVGGLYLQVTDQRPQRGVTADDYSRLGALLTEIGKRTADLGIPLGYHNHMNNLGERPEEIAGVLDASDPRFVKLELDTAHYLQGGGDPVKAVHDYRDRLLFLHIKDLESPVAGTAGVGTRSYRFVELGRGRVDLKGVFSALDEIQFKGWAIVELDRVPDPGRTPKQSATMAREYIERELKLTI
jgi:inosose dehydratase